MNELAYLYNKLKLCSQYKLSELDKNYLKNNSMSDFIFKKVTSKKFRKWSISDDLREKIKEKIELKIKNNKPIEFVFPFGGYKLWRLPTFPEVDWADFFSVSYYCEYIAPIISAYEPGVKFIFYSVDFVVERINNVSQEYTGRYLNSFERLLKIFSKYFPNNLKIEIMRASDLYEEEELEQELSSKIKNLKKYLEDQEEEKIKKLLKSSELNVMLNGKEDWTKLNRAELREKMINGIIIHEAQHLLSKRREFVDGKNRIRLSANKLSLSIPLGTTKSSAVKFWVGLGVLEKSCNKFKDIILSPYQVERLEEKRVDAVNVGLSPFNEFNNLKEIKVIKN